jgi:hypothetical protein
MNRLAFQPDTYIGVASKPPRKISTESIANYKLENYGRAY